MLRELLTGVSEEEIFEETQFLGQHLDLLLQHFVLRLELVDALQRLLRAQLCLNAATLDGLVVAVAAPAVILGRVASVLTPAAALLGLLHAAALLTSFGATVVFFVLWRHGEYYARPGAALLAPASVT